MAKLIWAPLAADDLEAICDYIARDSAHYARVVARRIHDVVKFIQRDPLMGQVVAEYGREDIRERPMQNYRIIYRVRSDSVEIVRVVHGARLLRSLDSE